MLPNSRVISSTPAAWRACKAALRSNHYDAVIDAQGLMKSAFVARLVKAPVYGLDKHSARERMASSAYQHKIAIRRDLHAVERIRLLFAAALDYPLGYNQGTGGEVEDMQDLGLAAAAALANIICDVCVFRRAACRRRRRRPGARADATVLPKRPRGRARNESRRSSSSCSETGSGRR